MKTTMKSVSNRSHRVCVKCSVLVLIVVTVCANQISVICADKLSKANAVATHSQTSVSGIASSSTNDGDSGQGGSGSSSKSVDQPLQASASTLTNGSRQLLYSPPMSPSALWTKHGQLYAQSSYYYADYKLPRAPPVRPVKQTWLPQPQICPQTGRTVCEDVDKYPL